MKASILTFVTCDRMFKNDTQDITIAIFEDQTTLRKQTSKTDVQFFNLYSNKS